MTYMYIEQGAHYIRKSLINSTRKAFLENAVVELCQTAFMLACTLSIIVCILEVDPLSCNYICEPLHLKVIAT